MFYLIGADGREYGPFTVEQIRDWVAQGRANAHSRVRRDGETSWQPLKDFAEFAEVSTLAAAPPPGTPPPALSPESLAADYQSRGAAVDVGSCITRGWALVRDNPGLTIGSTLLVLLVSFGLSLLPVVGLVAFFINPVLFGGLAYTFTRRIRGEQPSVGDAFSGFSLAFLHLGLGRPRLGTAHLCRPAAVRAARHLPGGRLHVRPAARHRQAVRLLDARWKSAAASSTDNGGRCSAC